MNLARITNRLFHPKSPKDQEFDCTAKSFHAFSIEARLAQELTDASVRSTSIVTSPMRQMKSKKPTMQVQRILPIAMPAASRRARKLAAVGRADIVAASSGRT